MINGQVIAFRSDSTNYLGPELISMQSIERIEIVRGPGSALYGANAFLGVVNIITKDAMQGGQARVYAGAFDEGDGETGSLDLTFGKKSTTYSAPRYNSV